MKIRNGFVSNSSSSSFVIFYKEATRNDLKNKNVYILDLESYDGYLFYRPSDEIIDYLIENNLDIENVIYVYSYLNFNEDKTLTKKQLTDNFKELKDDDKIKIRVDEIDQSSGFDSLDDFLENYEDRIIKN